MVSFSALPFTAQVAIVVLAILFVVVALASFCKGHPAVNHEYVHRSDKGEIDIIFALGVAFVAVITYIVLTILVPQLHLLAYIAEQLQAVAH